MAREPDSHAAASQRRLQVGQWTLEPERNRASTATESVKVEPKAMDTLIYLANRPGQVVSRAELLSAVWPDVVVGDDSLTQVVIKLRKALGDAADEPRFIETIPKRGYRLIAPVRVMGDTDQPLAGAPTPPPEAPEQPRAHADPEPVKATARRHALWLAAAVAGGALVTTIALWRTGSPATEGARPPVAATNGNLPVQENPTITVERFDVLGNDPDESLLAQGVTADLVTDLSRVSGLTVIGPAHPERRSDGGAESAAQPQRYRISGSVQRIGPRLRLQARLSNVRTGELLWSERFDRELNSLFAIQDELGPKILSVLPGKVAEAELRRVATRHTRNLEAYRLFQRGQLALIARQHADNEAARALFERAIALDPRFARAYAALALTYAADHRNQWGEHYASALDRAFEIAQTAIQIDPSVPETSWVLAFVHMEHRRHDQALRYLEAAVRANPSFADGYALIGGIQTYIGRPAESIASTRTAMRLDPLATHLQFLNLGRAYLFLGDAEQARVNLAQSLLRNPANLESHVYMAAVHLLAGDKAAATWEAEEIRTLRPGFSIEQWLATYPMSDEAQNAKLARALRELGF